MWICAVMLVYKKIKKVRRGDNMKNPIIKGFYADPDVAVFDGKVYIYPTTDCENWTGTSFKVFSSEDLENWTDEGVILNLADVPWSGGIRAWAPAIAEKNGRYYFYYTGNMRIGVAVSDSPTGPFVDKGSPLIEECAYEGSMIDPDVFVDDDGTAYLYWGNTHLYVAKLSDDMLSLASEPKEVTPPDYSEATCVFKRGDIYYYTWSCGDTRSPDYHIRYGKATSPMEKPKGNTVILHRNFAEDKTVRGTGHHTILNIPGTDDWYIIYHRFNAEKYGDVEGYSDEAGCHRELCIDKMYFDENGNILPVKPTN